MWPNPLNQPSDYRRVELSHSYPWEEGDDCYVLMGPATGSSLSLSADLAAGRSPTDRIRELLRMCVTTSSGRSFKSTELGALVLGDRNLLLAELARASFGSEIDLQQKCSNPNCGVEIEWPFQLANLASVSEPRRPSVHKLTINDREVTVRAATVEDERLARQLSEPVTALIDLCVEPSGLISADDQESIKKVEAAFEELDPLASIEFTLDCLSCEEPMQTRLDLTSVMADLVVGDDRSRSVDHHVLALAYGWSPAALLSLRPVERRDFADTLLDLWESP